MKIGYQLGKIKKYYQKHGEMHFKPHMLVAPSFGAGDGPLRRQLAKEMVERFANCGKLGLSYDADRIQIEDRFEKLCMEFKDDEAALRLSIELR